MDDRPKRRLVVTVRAAADLSEPAGSAYVAVTLGGETVETDVARIGKGSVNPVGASPGLGAGRTAWAKKRRRHPAGECAKAAGLSPVLTTAVGLPPFPALACIATD